MWLFVYQNNVVWNLIFIKRTSRRNHPAKNYGNRCLPRQILHYLQHNTLRVQIEK
jgi:hypothetical protein